LSTSSLRSSIYEYVEEHGRTFHKYKAGSECHSSHDCSTIRRVSVLTWCAQKEYFMPNDRVSDPTPLGLPVQAVEHGGSKMNMVVC